MASGTIAGDEVENRGAREKQRYSENKVYTRKAFKGSRNNNINNSNIKITATSATDNEYLTTANATVTTATSPAAIDDNEENKNNNNSNKKDNGNHRNSDNGNVKDRGNENDSIQVPQPPVLASEDTDCAQRQSVLLVDTVPNNLSNLIEQQQPVLLVDAVSNSLPNIIEQHVVTLPSAQDPTVANGVVKQGLENRVKINLASKSKHEMRELRKKLVSELDMVRSLVKRIEDIEAQLGVGGLSIPLLVVNDRHNNGLKRVNSEVGSVAARREIATPISTPTPRQSRPLNQLSISVLENSQGLGEIVEKGKRTPKANQFYRNSEFLLAKDKFPPSESNKKSKLNGKKHRGGHLGLAFGMGTKIFKNCSALLEKLMKHKHGWVFNEPVDVDALGLSDYFTIIKNPMDLGTVKSRLNKNRYQSPEEFAGDVRLTFHNALRYNPKGQDVHVMADQLLNIFEDRWAVIKLDYEREMRFAASYEVGIPTPTSRKTHPFLPPPLDMRRILDRSISMTYSSVDARPKSISTTPSGRTPSLKKPKAKDPDKRDMTYEEKQKLSTNLQNLPSDKLDSIVQIIKKRNSTLSQHDDEIEVDIDRVDTETLWELDRFVTNYKKNLSKKKRKAELAIRARAEAELNVQVKTSVPVAAVAPKENKDERNVSTSSPVRMEKQGDNASRSSSSSSSSSDSGSSSSDSDSDSSSTSGSDVGH